MYPTHSVSCTCSQSMSLYFFSLAISFQFSSLRRATIDYSFLATYVGRYNNTSIITCTYLTIFIIISSFHQNYDVHTFMVGTSGTYTCMYSIVCIYQKVRVKSKSKSKSGGKRCQGVGVLGMSVYSVFFSVGVLSMLGIF